THRCRGIDHWLGEADDVHLSGVEILQRLDQDALTAGEAIESAHFEGVSRPEVVQAGKPLRAVRDAAGLAVVDDTRSQPAERSSASCASGFCSRLETRA